MTETVRMKGKYRNIKKVKKLESQGIRGKARKLL